MKTLSFFPLVLILSVSFAGEQPSTEIASIDKRLEELKTIWHQEQAIINGYTKNRTVAVTQGSKEYYACLESSKRINLAEQEAKTLKEKRKSLEASSSKPQEKNPTEGKDENENFKVSDLKVPSVSYERKLHGPKVKDLFIGMSMTDFCEKAASLANTPYRSAKAIQEAPAYIISGRTGVPQSILIPENSHLITPVAWGVGTLAEQGIVGFAESKGSVKSIIISGEYAKEIFKSRDLKLEEFVKNFAIAYDVELSSKTDTLPMKFTGTSREGVLIEINSDFGVTIKQGTKAEETQKAFD